MEFGWVEMQLADRSAVMRRTIGALESLGCHYRLSGLLAAAAYSEATFGADVTGLLRSKDLPQLKAALSDSLFEEAENFVTITSDASTVRFRFDLTDASPESIRGEVFGVPCALPRADALFSELAASLHEIRGIPRALAGVALAALAEAKPELEPLLPAELRW